MMLHKLAIPLVQSVTDCVVKRHTDYLGLQSDKQIFTLASLEHHSMTIWILVSNQNIFTVGNQLTQFVLLRSILPQTFSLFQQNQTRN